MNPHFVLFLALLFSIPVFADDAPPIPNLPLEKCVGQIPVEMNYYVYLPADYGKDPAKKWPLIVFLHGRGTRDKFETIGHHGPLGLVMRGTSLPVKNFVIAAPLCTLSEGYWKPYKLDVFLDEVLAKYKVDFDRVYLTGVSMGGYGTWLWAENSPQRFAAIAPMSGGGDPNPVIVARQLAHMPVWDFHGEADPTVPISESKAMLAALKKAGNHEVKFTSYPGVGHDCWERSYSNPELYNWFLKFKRYPLVDEERPR